MVGAVDDGGVFKTSVYFVMGRDGLHRKGGDHKKINVIVFIVSCLNAETDGDVAHSGPVSALERAIQRGKKIGHPVHNLFMSSRILPHLAKLDLFT